MPKNPTKASQKGFEYFCKNPNATAEEIAKKCGMSIHGIYKSAWWKARPKESTK